MIDISVCKLGDDTYNVQIEVRHTCCVTAAISSTEVVELRHNLHNELLYLDRVIRREGLSDD